MSDAPKQLGKYQIRRPIGKGAMGIVYEGFDPVIDRIVAIKTIRKDELDKEEAEEHSRRFLIEAKAAGRLNHKNIVGIYDYGEEKGLSFIVMEFVQGKELKSFFAAHHPFSMSQIVRLMGELLDALGYSHSRGVVHRDVKPDNIFVTDDGSVKLGDFGIARIDSTSKTHAGTVLGTPSYMAPEQIRGETADARSDLYAAGVILYQFLVGERPFSGGMVAVMQKVLMEAPKPPSSHNPSIPEAIDAVVLKALAKSGNDRFASAAEFSRELTSAVGLSDAEDESESTMIMTAETLKALQDSSTAADRTGTGGTHTGTGGTHTGTGTGTTTGRSTSGGRGVAIEEARRRAEEAKRRYEEDLKRAEVELQEAEAEQQAAEVEAQAQAEAQLKDTRALLDESKALVESGQALFPSNELLVGGPDNAAAGRAVGTRMRESAAAIGEFVSASYALSPAAQAELEARQAELAAAAATQEALVERIDREARAAREGFEQKLEVLERRLAGQDGAWGTESRALEALDASAGDATIAPIQSRLDKLATSVDQVAKGFASVKTQPLKLPTPLAERLAVVEAQLTAQSGFVARLRSETDAARQRVKAAAEARRVADEEARKAAEAEAVRKKAEEAARLKAEAEAAAEKKRLAEEQAKRDAEAARKAAEAAALEKQRLEAEARREAEERGRREAEAAAKAKAEAEAAAEKARLAEQKARADAAAEAERLAAEVARKKGEMEAAADRKRAADEEAARVAKAEAQRKADEAARKAAEAAEIANRKADDEARKKAEADARREAQAAARREADEQARQKAAEAAQRKAEEEARKKAEADARRQAEAEAKAKADAAAKEKAAFEAKRRADEEEAARKAEAEAGRARDAALAATDAEATLIARVPTPVADDAESTMIQPVRGKAATPAPASAPAVEARGTSPRPAPPAPAPAPAVPGKKLPLIPIAGVAVVVLAAGAWFALRPAPSGEPVEPPAVVAAAAPAPAPAPSAVQTPLSAVQPPVDVPAAAPASAPVTVAQADGAASKATALPVDDAEARQRKADEDARKKADAELKAKAKAEIELQRKADLEAKAKADGDGKPPSDADPKAKAKADAKADAEAAAAAKPVKSDPKAEAAEAFRKGYEAYLSGRVPEGIRMMEKADSMGAQGARARLCAIYRKPTAAEGKDFLKEANKCKGVD